MSDRDLVGIAAFAIVEQTLAWLSSLEDEEREVYIEGLDKEERTLVYALVSEFYLKVPEMDRVVTNSEAFRILSSAWTTRSKIWMGKRWDSISKVAATVVSAFIQRKLGSADIAGPAEELIKSLSGEGANAARSVLAKLVEFVRAFGFEGVCVLVDKLDETEATATSAESTAKLIYPLLAHIQLLEVNRFSWILFLWSNLQEHFNGKYSIRLDKIANANITWEEDNLRKMVDKRIKYFSQGNNDFDSLVDGDMSPDGTFRNIVQLSMQSPRELIKLLDTTMREHDAKGIEALLLGQESFDLGMDKYSIENIHGWFDSKTLQQVLRLGKTSFVNKDVQTVFRIGDQGARMRIKRWVDEGLVRQSGTSPSDVGGKPVYRYIVADDRVERIINRHLDEVVGAGPGEDDSGDLLEMLNR